jgi:hypothetical protein
MFLCLQSMMLMQNGYYSKNLFPNSTAVNNELTILQNKVNYDLVQSIVYVNNLTFKMSTLDDNLSYTYSNVTFQILGGYTNNNLNTYSYESNDLNVKVGKIIAQNFSLVFENLPYIFNYNTTRFGNETSYFVNFVTLNNNSITAFRKYTEKINQRFRDIIQNSDLVATQQPSYFCLFGIFISIFIYFILGKIMSNVTAFKTKILKIFFLIDKKWADIIIKRCKRYLDSSQNYLISKEEDDRISFFLEGGEKGDEDHIQPGKKKTANSLKTSNKKPNILSNMKKTSEVQNENVINKADTIKLTQDEKKESKKGEKGNVIY